MATWKNTYTDWVQLGKTSSIETEKRVIIKKLNVNNEFLSIGLNSYSPKWDVNVGDDIDIIFDFTIPKSYWDTDDKGNNAPTRKYLIDYFQWHNYDNNQSILIDPNNIIVDDFLDALADPSKLIRVQAKLELNKADNPDVFVDRTTGGIVTFIDIQPKMDIDGKRVKSLNIGGHNLKDFTIDGHKYLFNSDITMTADDVKAHVAAHTTWVSKGFEKEIVQADYTSSKRDSSFANVIFLQDWKNSLPSIDGEIINSVKIYISDDIELSGLTSETDGTGARMYIQNYEGTDPNGVGYKINFNDGIFNNTSIIELKAGNTYIIDVTGVYLDNTNTATIDTTAKISGLTVDYSKSTGITDGESITATVKFDASVADSLNGSTGDFVVSNIVVVSPDRTVTEQEVTDYIDANIDWSVAGTSIISTYTIDSGDYSTVEIPTNTNGISLVFNDWTTAPNGNLDLTVNQTISITFNNDITIIKNPILKFRTADNINSYKIFGPATTADINIKSGETWLFAPNKAPIKQATSANLDVTKWPALHPGTKLYTPDLHMISGEERTFTVQADHGYTVNGGASVDYKYTPTNLVIPSGPYLTADDYVSYSNSSKYEIDITDWDKTSPSFPPKQGNENAIDSFTMEFKTDGTIALEKSQFNYVLIRYTESGTNNQWYYAVRNMPNSAPITPKAGDIINISKANGIIKLN